jgi:putative membrane protein insertion efficiency factor
MLRAGLGMLEASFRWLMLALVRFYRYWLKPWLGNSCRFEPSCSSYAMQALNRHGAARGAALAGWRILRCSPWCAGGCDPVPELRSVNTGRWPWPGATQHPVTPFTPSSTSGGIFTSLVPTEAAAAPADSAPANRKQA